MSDPLSKLRADREALLRALSGTGDMRRGSITEVFRSCGKATCACASADHPGHGPYYAFTTKVDGKTKSLQLRPGPLLSKIEREVEEYRGFRATCDRLLEVNEAICDARPVQDAGPEKKRRSSTGVVEAGCKTAVGTRCKRAGMHWTVAGADAIIALRCCKLSGRFEDFRERRARQIAA